MKNKIFMICLILTIGTLAACGSKGSDDENKVKLSNEFTLESKKVKDSTSIGDILFAKEVTKTKVSSLNPDKKGMALDYSLDQAETEKLINLLQKDVINGVEATKEEYNSTALRDSYGCVFEFVDSLDRFYEGVSRLTSFTTSDVSYLAVIEEGGGTKLYRIELSADVVSFLNEASAAHYESSKGRGGWFNKVFN